MTLTELCAEVASVVNRADLQDSIIKSHVKAATFYMHSIEDWWQDLSGEQIITFAGGANYYQTIDHTLLTRFRKWDTMRVWDPAGTDPLTLLPTGSQGKWFTLTKEKEGLFDVYGKQEDYSGTVFGTTTKLRGTATFSAVLAGYFSYPVVTPDGSYSSWIANASPYSIVYRAASLMYAGVGQQDQARKWEKMEKELRDSTLSNFLLPQRT